jgi:hypothetical protein
VQGEDSQVNVEVRFSTQIKKYTNRCLFSVGIVCSLWSSVVNTNCNIAPFSFICT